MDTAFDPGRNESRFNGSLQNVNRPVYDQSGNVIGYNKGQVWFNDVTGKMSEDTTTTTLNAFGGTNKTHVKRIMAAPRR